MIGTLYINGKKADCDQSSLALFTYRREDLDNPTVVRNSYSQQIRLAGTPANDDIFGHFARGNRITGATGFDAAARTPFVLYGNGGIVLESGYCKLDGIERAGASVAYLVTLYGGLGEILYKLSAADDGTPLTLADMDYYAGGSAYSFGFTVSKDTVSGAWIALNPGGLTPDPWWTEVVNFAPCYNGKPTSFDAAHLIAPADGTRIVTSKDGYTALNGYVNITLGCGEVCEHQVGDFRCYLQRPVLKVEAVLDAIGRLCTSYGWTLNLDADFFKSANPYYHKAWMTLPRLIDLGLGQGATATKAALLSGTMSPLAFLVGYCRHFGLIITANHIGKTLDIRTRKTYYDSTLPKLDLSGRITSAETQATTPLTFDARWYLLGEDPVGAVAEDYGKRYRTPYGMLRIDTGYAFNDEERKLLDGQPFKGAIMVSEAAVGMGQTWSPRMPGNIPNVAAVAMTDGSTYSLGSGDNTLTVPVNNRNGSVAPVDGPSLIQLHDASSKNLDAFVLLFEDGVLDAGGDHYFVTDDDQTYFDALNAGAPCWHWISASSNLVGFLPLFSRYLADHDEAPAVVSDTWDYATPAENYAPDYDLGSWDDMWTYFWAGYIADRFDIDAKVVKVKANIHGLPRPAELLRHFVWWDAALWSVNAIEEWDPLGDGLTTLELVRVKDPANYRQ